MGIAKIFSKLLGRKSAMPREQVMKAFKRRYISFKDLLQSNTDLANILASIDNALHGNALYGISEVRADATKAVFHAMRMVSSLNAISGNAYTTLDPVVEAINKRISSELDERPPLVVHDFTLPLSAVNAEHSEAVGGKSANLGELRNVAHMPVPRGFAVTTAAYRAFLEHCGESGDLTGELLKQLRNAEVDKPETIVLAARAIENLLMAAPMPPELEEELLRQWDNAFGKDDPEQRPVLAALRSSAVAEDGYHSFAGQYKTVLGVRRSTLMDAFREVTASLFSPRAITYRLHHGYIFEEISMAMCCLEMVNAVSAGVAFSRHPVDLRSEDVVINGLWGLGELVVDGDLTPDTWLVARSTCAPPNGTTAPVNISASRNTGEQPLNQSTGLRKTIVHKPHLLRLEDELGETLAVKAPVDPGLCDAPCLTDEQALQVARMALTLENHYKHPQDMEWAVDRQGQILLLQSRPMRMADKLNDKGLREPPQEGHTLLLEGADIAAPGVGYGPIYHVETEEDLTRFPEGAILLTRHSSPNLVVAMQRAEAIIAETGSLTGHMASVSREFNVATLMNIPHATELEQGRDVTVDAFSGRVYDGKVEEILALRPERSTNLEQSPIHALLQRVAAHITPLHLIDPKSALFAPQNCTTLHDVMRYVHELSYTEMFRLSDSASDAGAVAVQLRCSVPLDLCVIDLGEGLRNPEARWANPDDVTSLPFRQLLRGMLAPDVQARGPRPVDMQGFLAVMGQSMIGGNNQGGERFGDRSYAIVSDRYCNFSSRVGYHYAVLDAWCGDTVSKNYVTFKFAGGAADENRRARRVRCIGLILQRLGFTVDVVLDRVQARIQKYPRADMEERLEQLGRLLIVTRQMDMLMVNEESITLFADKFMRGEYH